MADHSKYDGAGNHAMQEGVGSFSFARQGVALNSTGDTLTAKIDEAERNRVICQLTGGRGVEIDKTTGKAPAPAPRAGTLGGLKAIQAKNRNTIVVGASPDGKTWDPWKGNEKDKQASLATAKAIAELPLEKSIPVANLKSRKPDFAMDGIQHAPSPYAHAQ